MIIKRLTKAVFKTEGNVSLIQERSKNNVTPRCVPGQNPVIILLIYDFKLSKLEQKLFISKSVKKHSRFSIWAVTF